MTIAAQALATATEHADWLVSRHANRGQTAGAALLALGWRVPTEAATARRRRLILALAVNWVALEPARVAQLVAESIETREAA